MTDRRRPWNKCVNTVWSRLSENAGLENNGPNKSRGGKCRTGNDGLDFDGLATHV